MEFYQGSCCYATLVNSFSRVCLFVPNPILEDNICLRILQFLIYIKIWHIQQAFSPLDRQKCLMEQFHTPVTVGVFETVTGTRADFLK